MKSDLKRIVKGRKIELYIILEIDRKLVCTYNFKNFSNEHTYVTAIILNRRL